MGVNMLNRREIERLHKASLKILQRIGVRFLDATSRDLLAKAGCQVDGSLVRFKAKQIEDVLASRPKGFDLYGRDGSRCVHYAPGHMNFRPSGGLPYILDWEPRRRRKATMDDARQVVRLLDALDGFDVVNSVVSPAETPAGIQNVYRFINAHQNSLKPSDITVMTAREVRLIAEIGAAIRGGGDAHRRRPLTAVYVSPISPLTYAAEQAEAVMEVARQGLPLALLPCPTLGVTGPITLAGSVALQNAEMLAGIVLAYQVQPGLPVVVCTRISRGDMRTGVARISGPEIGLASAMTAQLAAYYGLPSNGYGFGTSATTPDLQSGAERALAGLMAAQAGITLISGGGSLGDALTTSMEQLALDNEFIGMVRRCVSPPPIDEQSLALDVIASARVEGTFLGEEHTAEFVRGGGAWAPDLFDPAADGGTAASIDRDLVAAAQDRVKRILSTHVVPPLDPEVQRQIDAIMQPATGSSA